MNNNYKLSHVTKKYIDCFLEILETMITGMTDAKLNESISHNFIMQMIPHHQAAIEMSKNILKYTTCIPVQNIALNIVDEQTKSIEDMLKVIDCCNLVENKSKELKLYQERFTKITETMFSRMRKAPITNNINQNFIREMIPHHEGAIFMCENLLCFKICPELRPIAQAIITSQRRGVKRMNQLLCRR